MSRLVVLALALMLPLHASAQTQDLPAGDAGTIVVPVVISPVAPEAMKSPVLETSVVEPSATEPVPPQTTAHDDVSALKQNVSDLKQIIMAYLLRLESRIKAVEAGSEPEQAGMESLGQRLTKLEASLAALEAGQPPVRATSYPTIPSDLAAQVEALVANALEQQKLALIEAVLQKMQGATVSPQPFDIPLVPQPDPEPYNAVVGGNGRLVSFYKSQLGASEMDRMLTESDCAEAGAWFDETHQTPDYRSFFVKSANEIKVCSKVSMGWKILRAESSKRAHLLKSGR